MKVKFLLPALLLGFSTFFSCKDGDPVITFEPPDAPAGKYAAGIFVVNEGPFGGTGSVTWHNPATGETVQDVFATENNGAVLGQFVQSLTFHNSRGYIVVNGANKIYVVDAATFKFIDTIGGLVLPRFLLPLDNDFAYVSQWGANGLDGSVARVNLHTNEIVGTIPTGHGPDKMLRHPDGLVYVPNSGGFGLDSTISIINPAIDQELQRIAVPGKNPGTVAVGNFEGGLLIYAHCRGSFFDATPAGWVGPLDGTAGFLAPPYGDDLVSAPGLTAVYYTAGGGIYILDAAGHRRLFDQAAYGLACHPATGNLYCADARDFSSAGEVVIYTPAGQRLGSFPAGIAPGEIIVAE